MVAGWRGRGCEQTSVSVSPSSRAARQRSSGSSRRKCFPSALSLPPSRVHASSPHERSEHLETRARTVSSNSGSTAGPPASTTTLHQLTEDPSGAVLTRCRSSAASVGMSAGENGKHAPPAVWCAWSAWHRSSSAVRDVASHHASGAHVTDLCWHPAIPTKPCSQLYTIDWADCHS